ncbi:MAG: DNA-processing protein DprA [Clostridia bacterium]|nr:DNA-processing protein DprA [Clostridia bacterium]
MADSEYWIWLQTALGCGASTAELLHYYQTPQAVYDALCRREIDSFIAPALRKRLASVSPSQSYAIQKQCGDNGWQIITPDSAYFPDSFRHLQTMPLALYVAGDPAVLKQEFAVGFVGARQASRYGGRIAEELAYCVAAAGAVVVSGCALGIDSYSHLGALEAHGTTIGFLGTGLGEDYPKGNRGIRTAIPRRGALVSEYPPFTKGSKYTFPVRNRLIAALSLGVVVVEAAEKSGALITAGYAAEYGRDVFAVPGEITDSAFTGCHKLIRDGAKPVFNAADILEEYVYRFGIDPQSIRTHIPQEAIVRTRKSAPEKQTPPQTLPARKREEPPVPQAVKREKKTLPAYIDALGAEIYNHIIENGGMDADAAAALLHAEIKNVLSSLTMLELVGVVKKSGSGRYEPV